MDTDLAQKAVSSALSGNWEAAIKANKEILKENKKDVDALNRLARAYAESDDIARARTLSEKVLKIDPFNTIATKCLSKWKSIKGSSGTENHSGSRAEYFLEEPGKTKMVTLLHPGAEEAIAKLDSGDEVSLTPHAHRVSVVTTDGKYIGRLPDDLASRLRKFIKLGNKYKVLIKSTQGKTVKVFIKEIHRAKELSDTPSFVGEKVEYVSFTPPELVHKKEDNSFSDSEEEGEE